ncbi:MAG: hypothetical protein FWD52_07890 [Candidatus Bathyarchaeota archaeon]|nr:hypothetical protein [Candidatus Termiticorpusculum sp.]
MTLVEDYDGVRPQFMTLLLLVLSIDDYNHKKAMDMLHIQKTIELFEQSHQKKSVDLSNFKLDRVSYELEENMESLVKHDLIEQKNSNFALTPKGEKDVNLLKHQFDTTEFKKLVNAKQLLGDLSNDEILYFMYKTSSTTQEHSTELLRLERKAKSLVKSLFLKRKIDATTAAKWLDLPLADFVKKFHKKELSTKIQQELVKGYQQNADEDLAITKEFEPIDHEFDCECNNA